MSLSDADAVLDDAVLQANNVEKRCPETLQRLDLLLMTLQRCSTAA
jgi:hypothetical protein